MEVAEKVKQPKVSNRITKISVRENAKKDRSPRWDGAEGWTGQQFTEHFRNSMRFYHLELASKDFKVKVINWMASAGYSTDDIAAFKATKDWRCGPTMGALAACFLRGMPAVHSGFNQGRNSEDWLRKQVAIVIEEGSYDVQPEVEKPAQAAPVPTVQDRVREQAIAMSEVLEEAIDNWITNPEEFDPKSFKMINTLRGAGVKAAQARLIMGFYEKNYNTLKELASGTADEAVREAYSFAPKKHVRKLIEFYELINNACQQIIAEAKVTKKPRAKKVKPAEELVKSLKFKVSEDKLSIASIPPQQIVGAQGLVVYNHRTRKIGYYCASTSAGLSVKGNTITGFTEGSSQKTLRKPELQLKEFRDQNTQKRFETWFGKTIKTTETALNGRGNEELILLKVFK